MNVEEILIDLGYNLQEKGAKYWTTSALYRNGDNRGALCIDKDTGSFYDFVTKEGGSFTKLVTLTAGKEDAKKYLKDYNPDASVSLKINKINFDKVFTREILDRLLPDYSLYDGEGLTRKTFEAFEIGLAHSGKLNKRIVFPVYNDKKQIVGFSGRYYKKQMPVEVTKYKHIGKLQNWTYPAHLTEPYIKQEGFAIIVESPHCIMHLWEVGIRNTLCLFTTTLGKGMLNYLISLNLKKIVVSLNNEPDNHSRGNDAAEEVKAKLLKYFSEQTVLIHLPNKKDFGEQSIAENQAWFKKLKESIK